MGDELIEYAADVWQTADGRFTLIARPAFVLLDNQTGKQVEVRTHLEAANHIVHTVRNTN